jgi:hypothetical protein
MFASQAASYVEGGVRGERGINVYTLDVALNLVELESLRQLIEQWPGNAPELSVASQLIKAANDTGQGEKT